MTFFERRKVDFQRHLDRRRTYIDVLERVLSSALAGDVLRRGALRRLNFDHSFALSSTVFEIDIYLLHHLGGNR
jgi:hypothetical protein